MIKEGIIKENGIERGWIDFEYRGMLWTYFPHINTFASNAHSVVVPEQPFHDELKEYLEYVRKDITEYLVEDDEIEMHKI